MNKNKLKGYSLIAVVPISLFLLAWLKGGMPLALGLLGILAFAALLATIAVKGLEFLCDEHVKEEMAKWDKRHKP